MRTPFYPIHKSLGAKMLDFHGWEMPLQYSGIIDEHINARTKVVLFDVSHMGRFEVNGPNAYDYLQYLVTNDVSKLKDQQALYSPMCYDNGGIVDDVIIYMLNREKFLIVVNASNRQKDFDWIVDHSQSREYFSCPPLPPFAPTPTIDDVSDRIALLALQGPLAHHMLKKIIDLDINKLKPFELTATNIFGIECIISRTGYTGEDGFELFFDSSKIEVWNKLMQMGSRFNIKPAGLGSRDTLRLEAGLMLYGNDIDENTTPLEVPLKWTVKVEKKGKFIGKERLLAQKVNRKLVGFEVLKKRIARHGNKVLMNGVEVGFVTSGNFSPTLDKSIGFCFVPLQVSVDQLIEINIGGSRLGSGIEVGHVGSDKRLYEARVTNIRFYKRNKVL